MLPLAKRRIGANGPDVTVLGCGGAPLGNLFEIVPEERAQQTLSAAWDAGVRLFDVAPLYGQGLAELRFGHALRDRPRDELVVSTKVGRWLTPARGQAIERGAFVGGLNFRAVVDYSYDGTMRALEQSHARLGLDRIDIVLIHDLDIWTHGAEAFPLRFREAVSGAYRALDELRAAGVVGAIGAGVNEVAPCLALAAEGRFDCFMMAGRYTLLEQEDFELLFAQAEAQGFSLLLGGPFNSGILATGARTGATYNYAPAPPAILDRVARLEAVCARHRVPLAAAAIRFPLGQPRVASIVPGAVRPEEVRQNAAWMNAAIPDDLWHDLKAEGLLNDTAPVPTEAV